MDTVRHYSGISIADVCALTGLGENAPALFNVGLPRATDPKVGDRVAAFGKVCTVKQVWRSADAKSRDGLLHVTVDTGEYLQGLRGRAAAVLATIGQRGLF